MMDPARWGRVASRIAFAQAALSFTFFVFLFIYAETTNHGLQHRSLTVYLGVLAFVLGVPAAFMAGGLAFRSGIRSLTWFGVVLEGVWITFAVWAMVGQARDHDVDFLNNLPVYTLLAGAGLAAAILPFLGGGSREPVKN